MTQHDAGAAPASLPVDNRDGAYAWFVACVMATAYMVSIMDRSILPLLITPIQGSMGLSDTTISLLQGATFAIFFALFGIPLARLADRGNRRNLIIPAVCFWCLATIACGLARSGEQLFLARICVAIGEAVLAPSALSILADYFTPKARVRAMSLWSMGSFFGGGLALAGGGALYAGLGGAPVATLLGPLESWRIVFIVLGASGLLLIPLLMSVREPRRVTDQGRPATGSLPLGEALRGLRAIGWPLVACIIGFSVASMGLVTMQAWLPTLFVRAHDWQLGAIGKQLGLFSIVLGPLGAFSGAVIAERLERRGVRNAKFRVGIGATLACCVSALVTTLASASVAMGGALCVIYFVAFNFGLTQAALAELLPNRLRGLGAAVFVACSNTIGTACGPLFVGLLNDHVFHDPDMLPVSLRIVAPTAFLVAAIILASGLKSYARAVQGQEETAPPTPVH